MKDLTETRLVSLDAFRGATIAAMILVNNPGSWKFVYPPLRHAVWHGWTPTDLIFPFFLFIVGVSLSFSLTRRRESASSEGPLLVKILIRSLILFVLGLLLTLFPRFDFGTLRIPGVLQRIALCYLVGSLIFLKTGSRARVFIASGLLAAYGAALQWIPVPGHGAGALSPDGNLCGWIDVQLLGGHLYTPNFDPEGILSTIPAIATVLFGTLAGDWLRTAAGARMRFWGLMAGGALLTVSGLWLHTLIPINKQLWTSSFVLFTGGAACLALGICYGVMDVLRWRKAALPFLVFGTNAILVYVGSGFLARVLQLVRVPLEGGTVSAKAYVFQSWLVPWAGPQLGSLLFPLLLLVLWFCLTYPLYRKRIFLKV